MELEYSLEELVTKRNSYLKEFWYGYRLWYLPQFRPKYGSKYGYTILRVEEVYRLVLALELKIALCEV